MDHNVRRPSACPHKAKPQKKTCAAPKPVKQQTMSNVPIHEFQVNLVCEGCCKKIRAALGGIKGIENVETNVKQQLVRVQTSLPAQQILDVMAKTGKEVKYLKST